MKRFLNKLKCKSFGHKYGNIIDCSKNHVAWKCERCDHMELERKDVIREIMFGWFDE